MDTLKIKAFLLIEQYRSFSKAAAKFSYTPSALSHMADSLEDELGVRLFHRTHTGVELTDAGRELSEKFHAAAEAEQALFDAAGALSAAQDTTLRIGAYSSIALSMLPEILQRFRQAYPAVKISILVADQFQADEKFPDVIFSASLPERMTTWVPMTEDAYVAVVPASQFPNRRSVSREELYVYPYIYTNESDLDAYFDYSRFRELIHLTSDEYGPVISMVEKGIGISVLPRLAIKERPNGVRVLQLQPRTVRTLGFAFRDDGKHAAAAQQFIRFLRQTSTLQTDQTHI